MKLQTNCIITPQGNMPHMILICFPKPMKIMRLSYEYHTNQNV